MHLLYRSNNSWKVPPLVWTYQWPSSQPLSSPRLSHNDSLRAWGITKSHREQGLEYREAKELLDAHLGQIVCDKDGVVDWCIVQLEMPLTRFQECWPFPWESLPELPKNLNIVTLTLTLWPINSGVVTSLLLTHPSLSLTDSLLSLNLLYHSKTDARFMQHGRKAVWSIPYISMAFFPSLKQNFISYRFSKVSSCPDSIFEIHQLWQSGVSRGHYNCYCSCLFELEIIKIGQSSHKMYSNNFVNFQESTII